MAGFYRSIWFRFVALFLICFWALGGYAAYDAVGVVKLALMSNLGIDETQFAWLYSAYTVPSIFIPTVAGRLTDLYGTRSSLLISLSVSFVGGALVALGASWHSYAIMIVGRVLFGLGTESGYVARNNVCLNYFTDELGAPYLAVAMSFTVVSGRIGTLLTFLTTTWFVDDVAGGNYIAGLWYGALWCGVSLALSVVWLVLDRHAEQVLGVQLLQVTSHPASTGSGNSSGGATSTIVDSSGERDALVDDPEELKYKVDSLSVTSASTYRYLWHQTKLVRRLTTYCAFFFVPNTVFARLGTAKVCQRLRCSRWQLLVPVRRADAVLWHRVPGAIIGNGDAHNEIHAQ
jgi:MFS family permease